MDLTFYLLLAFYFVDSVHYVDTMLSKTLVTQNSKQSKVEDARLAMVYNTSDLLDTLLDGYDKKLRPNFGGKGPICLYFITIRPSVRGSLFSYY